MVKGVYRELQGVTAGYKRLKEGVRRNYKRL